MQQPTHRHRRYYDVVRLPAVGPMEGNYPHAVDSLEDLVLTTSNRDLLRYNVSTRFAPVVYGDLEFQAGNSNVAMTFYHIFLWCDKLTMNLNTSMKTNGQGGRTINYDTDGPGLGGAGGSGGGTGGGCSQNPVVCPLDYENGKNGGNGGGDGVSNGEGKGGAGWGSTFWNGDGFTYVTGGNGGAGGDGVGTGNGTGGSGGTAGVGGAGGGGGGGQGDDIGGAGGPTDGWAGASGGGSGGLLVVVCRELTGTTNTFIGLDDFESNGGGGGSCGGFKSSGNDGGGGGGGGGGQIMIYAKKYDGQLSAGTDGGFAGSSGVGNNGTSGNAGTSQIYEISADEQTLTLRAFGDTWDNL